LTRQVRHRCVDPQLGQLLADELSGALTEPGREEDHRRFGEHIKRCRKCRETVLEHANEMVTIPLLKQIAQARGVSFEEVLEAFTREVRAREQSGKFRTK